MEIGVKKKTVTEIMLATIFMAGMYVGDYPPLVSRFCLEARRFFWRVA